MNIEIQRHPEHCAIKLAGRFDFSCHRDFRNAYAPLIDAREREIVVDLAAVDYLDSAALGMLLLLQERAEQIGAPVVLAGAAGVVRDILGVAHFERFFRIVD